MESIVAVLAGGVFGFALDRAKTNVPVTIAQQMELGNFTMMRMFLAASATSAAVVLALHLAGLKVREPKGGLALGLGKLGGYGGNFAGGALLGMGMYLSGSCPGTVWSQVGAGLPFTSAVIAGGLLGTAVFGYLEQFARQSNPKFHVRRKSSDSDLAPASVGYVLSSVAFILAAVGVVVALDMVLPWEQELAKVLPAAPERTVGMDTSAPAWDPAVAGMLVGLMQFPVQLSSGQALGQSSGWVMLAANMANAVDPDLKSHAPYLHKSLRDARAFYQLLLASGIVLGAVVSQHLSGHPALQAAAANGCGSSVRGFIGGFLLLLGARLGGGCTSGHGLSGMATLSAGSLVSVAGMFAGGMSLAAASHQAGLF